MAQIMEQTTIRFPAKLKKRAMALARRRKISFREFVRLALEQELGRPRKRFKSKDPLNGNSSTLRSKALTVFTSGTPHMNAQLIIFDLDGTLIDSKRDLVNSVNATRAFMGLDHFPRWRGRILYRQRSAGPDPPRFSRCDGRGALLACFAYFLDYYADHMLDATTLYPGVREALDRLHGADVAMAVLTNKPVRFSVALLEGLGIDNHFFRVYGGNSFEEKKPNPIGIRMLMEESGTVRERTLMVGDSAVDILTARNARVAACGVKWGFQPEGFATTPPDYLIDDMSELLALIK